jgi:hypothetical protein
VGWDPGSHGGTGDVPCAGRPKNSQSGRDPRLPGFASGGEWDVCPPSAALAAALEGASGPKWRCPDATRDEMVGLLRQWQALESWAAAGKLGVLRALVRDDDQPLPGGGYHGDLPEGWTKSLTHEVALALSMPAASADKLMWLAWNLQALLPGTGDLLASGDLTIAKARAVDTALCRDLAAAATGSPWTRLCVTVTDAYGIAIGHGCAKPARKPRTETASIPSTGTRPALALPARVNLTITASRLAELAAKRPPGTSAARPPGTWSLVHAGDPGPPDGYGTWTLTLPDGRQLTVHIEPVPTLTCDHRHESHAYQPSDTLRHLVQIRDGTCTFPSCSRHARESDFEHAVPYHKGGRTCACNAGARSRACHQVKQSPGWTVTQPRPGWHHWETPAGRGYTQRPKRYPV